jgi:gluconokinase
VNAIIVVIMGVAGAGKTTVGQVLATELGCAFLDADSLHSPENIKRMTDGVPLTDADRAPWLTAVHGRIVHSFQVHEGLVVACSALKQRYRETLARGLAITWVYLRGSEETIRARLQLRQHHFMTAQLLASQFADLEEPTGAIVVDVVVEPAVAVSQILNGLTLAPANAGENQGRSSLPCGA